MKRITFGIVLFLALVAPVPLPAQGGRPGGAVAAPEALEVVPIQAVEGAPGTTVLRTGSLPAPPRTLRAYWHLFIAFALTWLLLFGYVLSLGVRFQRLDAALTARE